MKCRAKYCRNDAYKNPNTGYQRKCCNRCKKRRFRKSKPYSYFWSKLKDSARERGIEFDLSKREFKEFWQRHPKKWKEKVSGVHGMCGKTWTVDRVDDSKGYSIDNIQVLSLRRNVIKYVRDDIFHLEVEWRNTPIRRTVEQEAPF